MSVHSVDSMAMVEFHRSPWRLAVVKVVHTVGWAFFAGCILAIPVASLLGEHVWAGIFGAIVMGECAILACNRGRCPLTDVAARYTDHREDNFDVYLPQWLARHNKMIFGAWYVGGLLFALWRSGVS